MARAGCLRWVAVAGPGGGGGVCVQGPSGRISGGEVKCPHGPHGLPLGQSGVVLPGL